jgi:hypothetical protein
MPVPVAVPVGRSDRGIRLWLPDHANSTAIGTWSAGTYGISVKVGDRIVHLVMVVRAGVTTG